MSMSRLMLITGRKNKGEAMKVVLHIYLDAATIVEAEAIKANLLTNIPYSAVDILQPQPDPDIVPEPITEPPHGN